MLRKALVPAAWIENRSCMNRTILCLPGVPLQRIRGSVNDNRRTLHRCGEMGRPRVVADKQARTGNQRDKLADVERLRNRRTFLDRPAYIRRYLHVGQTDVRHAHDSTFIPQPMRYSREILGRPSHCWQSRPRLQHRVWRAPLYSVSSQNLTDRRDRLSLRENLCPWYRRGRQTGPIELRNPVLDGMHHRSSVKFLRVGRKHVVQKRKLEPLPAHSGRRARCGRQQCTAWSSMLVESDRK